MWEAAGVPLPETHRYQAGLTFRLKRMWSKYIYLYYIPSALCVLVSLNSFFIKPEVASYVSMLSNYQSHAGCPRKNGVIGHHVPLSDHSSGWLCFTVPKCCRGSERSYSLDDDSLPVHNNYNTSILLPALPDEVLVPGWSHHISLLFQVRSW